MASNEWLVRKLHEQDKKIEALSRGGTGVGHSSIAPGENLTVISDNGEVVLGAGGVDHVDGPTPATPSAPTLKLGFGTIETTWDGTFAEGEDEDGVPLTAPVDFDVVEVHCSTDPEEEEWGEDTMRGQIKTREGGTITVGGFDVDDEVFVCLIALAKTGKRSAPSATASLVIEGLDFSQLFNEIDAANATIKNAGEVLVTEQDTLNDKLSDAFGQIGDAVASANGKNVVHYEDAPPTTADAGVEGDTWFVGQFGRPTDVVQATNLWLGSALSQNRSAVVTNSWNDGVAQTSEGLEITIGTTSNSSTSVSYTAGGFRVPMDAGKAYSFGVPIKNSGSVPFSTKVSFYFGTGGGSYPGPVIINPGDTYVFKAEGLTRSTADDVRWSLRYDSGDVVPPSGARITLLDKATCVQSEVLPELFNGDTPSGESDNDPHYRWTGTPHGSTSEKYLPATEGLSSNWNVTEQYRFINGAWENVELSHTVLSSLDLGKLVAGSAAIKEAVVQKLWAEVVVTKMAVAEQFIGENAILTGAVTAPKITASEELWAKIAQFVKIRAEHIEADAIDGMVITGPNIRTAASGARVQMDPNGVRVFNGDNDVRTHLSPDGSTFKGEVEAETLVVNDGAEFKGNNTLAQGAKLTLAAGVTDPTAPPVVQPYWGGVEFDMSWAPSLANLSGLAFDGTNYWTVKTTGAWIVNGVNGLRAIRITPTGGYDLYALDSGVKGFSELFGVTCIGSELFWLYRSGYKAYVLVTDLSCNKLREWEYSGLGYGPTNPLTYRPGIGNDGTNLVIAQCGDDGPLGVNTVNKTTGAIISFVRDTSDSTKSDITGVYVGNADWGRKLVTVAKKSTGELPSFNPTSGAYDGVSTKFNAASPESTGVVYVDGKWRTLDPAGVIHEYADPNTGDDSGDWWATYYWYTDVDDDNIIESSDYQSRMAPPARFTWPRRAMLKILGQPMPTGVEALGPALAKKTSTPTRTDFHGPSWQVDAGKPSARYTSLPANWATFASPSATNTFPEATSSVLESASGTFRVLGDGSGHWGPLTMGRNGVMSGLIVRGQVAITPDSANTVKQVTVNLPAGRFSKPPVVWAQLNTSVPHWCSLGVYQPTDTNTFTVFLTRTNTTTTDVFWFAMDSE